MAAVGDGGGDGRPGGGVVGGGCGGSTEGDVGVAAPHRGMWPDDTHVTSHYQFSLLSIT